MTWLWRSNGTLLRPARARAVARKVCRSARVCPERPGAGGQAPGQDSGWLCGPRSLNGRTPACHRRSHSSDRSVWVTALNSRFLGICSSLERTGRWTDGTLSPAPGRWTAGRGQGSHAQGDAQVTTGEGFHEGFRKELGLGQREDLKSWVQKMLADGKEFLCKNK